MLVRIVSKFVLLSFSRYIGKNTVDMNAPTLDIPGLGFEMMDKSMTKNCFINYSC